LCVFKLFETFTGYRLMMGNQMMVSLDRALSNTLLKRLHLMRTLDQTSSLIDKLF